MNGAFLAALAVVGSAAFPVRADAALPAAMLDALVREDDVHHMEVSPDGSYVALAMRADGHSILNIINVKDRQAVGTFGVPDGLNIGDIYWASAHRVMFGTYRDGGMLETGEFTGDLEAVDVDGKNAWTLLGREAVDAQHIFDYNLRDWRIVDTTPSDPDTILVAKYDRKSDSEKPFLYRINVNKGKRATVMQAWLQHGRFLTDRQENVRAMTGSERDGTNVVLVSPSTDIKDFKEIARFDDLDEGQAWPLGFDSDPKILYWLDGRSTNTKELYRLNTDTGQREVLVQDPIYDVEDLIEGGQRGRIIGAVVDADKPRWQYFDPTGADAQAFDQIRNQLAGYALRIINFTDDHSKAVILAYRDNDPGAFYLVDLRSHKIIFKASRKPDLKPAFLAHTEPIELKARDGLALHGYLTMPPSATPKMPSPMVVMLHGGPYGVRDTWTFNPEVQIFALAGYAVLQVNYRGSGGYGKDFEAAGVGQWGAAMQDDVTDATRWAIKSGYADPKRICIYGASYGAFSALEGVVREPELYRCAAGYAGVYDLATLAQNSDIGASVAGRNFLEKAVGTDPKVLRERSPAENADKIKVPVFLAHGTKDLRAPIVNMNRMRDALSSAGVPVETLIKDGEGHGFSDVKNERELYAKLIAFFDRSTARTTPPKQ